MFRHALALIGIAAVAYLSPHTPGHLAATAIGGLIALAFGSVLCR